MPVLCQSAALEVIVHEKGSAVAEFKCLLQQQLLLKALQKWMDTEYCNLTTFPCAGHNTFFLHQNYAER